MKRQDSSRPWYGSDWTLTRGPTPYNLKTEAEGHWLSGVLSSLVTEALALDDAKAFYQPRTADPSIDEVEGLCRTINLPYVRVVETVQIAIKAYLRGYGEINVWIQPGLAPFRLQASLVQMLHMVADAIENNPGTLDVPWPQMEERVKEIFNKLSSTALKATAAAANIEKGRRRSDELDLTKSTGRKTKTPNPQRIGEILFALWCERASRYSLAKALFMEGRFKDVASADKRIKEWESKAQRLLIPLGS